MFIWCMDQFSWIYDAYSETIPKTFEQSLLPDVTLEEKKRHGQVIILSMGTSCPNNKDPIHDHGVYMNALQSHKSGDHLYYKW